MENKENAKQEILNTIATLTNTLTVFIQVGNEARTEMLSRKIADLINKL